MATAHAILEGKWYLDMWGRVPLSVSPLYPTMIAAGESWLGLKTEHAAFLISVFSSCLLILLVFLWAFKRLGWVWAWVAALLVTLNTTLLLYGLSLLTESLFTVLFCSAAGLSWILLRRREHPFFWLGTGVLMGLAIITKSSAWILPAILLFWIAFHWIRGRYPVRQALYGGVALMAGVLLITQPVAWISQIPGGGGEFSGKKSIVSWLSKPDLRTAGLEREQYLAALTSDGDQFQIEVSQGLTLMDLLMSQGMNVVKVIFVNMGLAIQSLLMLIPWWLLIWIPGGVVVQWVTRNQNGIAFSAYLLTVSLGLMGFYTLAGAYTSAIGAERYTVPLIPLLILWATIGLQEVYRHALKIWGAQGEWLRPVGAGVVLFLLVLAFFPAVSQGKKLLLLPKEEQWKRSGSEMIGTWLQRNLGSGRKIMARDPAIPFYADGFWVLTPFEPIDRVIGYARKQGVHLMIVRGDVEGRRRPQLVPLLGRNYSHPALRRIVGVPGRQDPSRLDLAIFVLQ